LAQLHGDVGLDRKVVDVERALGVGQRFSRAAGRLELCADGSLACEHQMTPSRLSTRKRIRRSTCLFSSASIATEAGLILRPLVATPWVLGPNNCTIGSRLFPTRRNTRPRHDAFITPGRGPWNAPATKPRPVVRLIRYETPTRVWRAPKSRSG